MGGVRGSCLEARAPHAFAPLCSGAFLGDGGRRSAQITRGERPRHGVLARTPRRSLRVSSTIAQVEDATRRIDLWALVHQRLRFSKVSGDGVSYRMRLKMQSLAGNELRVKAFPPIPGFAEPPLAPAVKKPDTPAELEKLWTVDL